MILDIITIVAPTNSAADLIARGVEQDAWNMFQWGPPTRAVTVDYPGGLSQITLIYEITCPKTLRLG